MILVRTQTSSRRISSILLILLLLGNLPTPTLAADWGPWDMPEENQKGLPQVEKDPFDLAIRNFQKYISPLDGPRCPMYPTCSAYARQALHKHGPLLGILMTADRLIHEGDPGEQQESIIKWGYRRYFDPLSDNDYWLNNQQTD